MSGWPDLVTTALLGTDRRPVPTDLDLGWGAVRLSPAAPDAPSLVLSLAAAHWAAARAGAMLAHRPVTPEAPTERLPLAAPPAQDLLAGLLTKPDPGLVNAWLSCCATRGLGAAPELWPRLAILAARNSAYDRTLLVETLGPRGLWFLAQNPAWRRLLEPAAGGSKTSPPVDPAAALAYAEHGESPMLGCAMILACPDPLSTELVLAGVRLVATGALGAETRKVAVQLGYRVPLQGWSDLTAWTGRDLQPGRPVPAVMVRAVQLSLDLIERTVRSRIEIDDVFADPPQEETRP